MIKKILEYDYNGFHLVLAEEGGWKCIIGEKEILFPYATAAEAAIDELLKDADSVIAKHKGKVICKVPRSNVTKTVDVENPY